jgi:bacillolysin
MSLKTYLPRFLNVGFFSVLFILPSALPAQRYSGTQADSIFKGSTLVVIPEGAKIPSMMLMGEQTDYKAKAFPEVLQPVLKLRENEELKEYKFSKDYIGFTHHHYQQYFKNIKVEGGEFIVHEKLGRIISINGSLLENVEAPVKAKISHKEAIQLAMKHLGAKRYKWENPLEESRLRKMKKDSAATYYPAPELVIASKNLDPKKKDWHLCYKFDVYADEPMSRHWFFVDAINGEIVAMEDRINTAHPKTTTNTGIRGPSTNPNPGIRQEAAPKN